MKDETQPFTIQRATLEGFWEDLKWALQYLIAACGWPQAIAAKQILRAKAREDILVWLAPIEAMARRIVLLAALAQRIPNPPEQPPKPDDRLTSARADTPRRQPSINPADWRAIFCEWPRGAGAQRGARENARPPSFSGARITNALPLGRRVEALLRLADNPAPAIARMAAKIALRRAWLCFAFGHYRHDAGPVHTLLGNVQAHVDAALWNTS